MNDFAHNLENAAASMEGMADVLSRVMALMQALADHRSACASFVDTLSANLSPEARARLSTGFASYAAANDTFRARHADILASQRGADTEIGAPLRTMAATFREVARAAREAGTEATA